MFAGKMVVLLGLYQLAKTLNHDVAFKAAVIEIIEEYNADRKKQNEVFSAAELKARMGAEKLIFDGIAPYGG